MNTWIRTTFFIFCWRNKPWPNPEILRISILDFFHLLNLSGFLLCTILFNVHYKEANYTLPNFWEVYYCNQFYIFNEKFQIIITTSAVTSINIIVAIIVIIIIINNSSARGFWFKAQHTLSHKIYNYTIHYMNDTLVYHDGV